MNNKLKSHFINLYLVALSDGNFEEKELETILKIGEEKGLSKTEFEQIILNPTSVEFHYPETFIEKIEFLFDFTRVIMADEKIDDEEKFTFFKFCKKFGFEENESNELFDWLKDLVDKKINHADLQNEISKLLN